MFNYRGVALDTLENTPRRAEDERNKDRKTEKRKEREERINGGV